jgi:predicted RNase H-like nuclease (RuvC/YqgF family)
LERELNVVRAAGTAAAQQQQPPSGGLDARIRSSTVLENENVLLRQEIRAKSSDLDALREQREVLYREVEVLNLKLQRVTPHKNEVDGLRAKLRTALSDLDRAEDEIRRLRGY